MKFIKHKKMRDVCFQIYEELSPGVVKGCWVNIALGDPFPIGNHRGYAVEIIEVKDPENWKEYNDPRAAKASNESA